MRAEHIHDALNLLPEDLIEKVDRLRTRQRMPIRRGWRSFGAIAACLAVLILGAFVWGMLPGTISCGTDAFSIAADQEIAKENLAPQDPAELDRTASDSANGMPEYGLTDSEPDAYGVTAQYIPMETAALAIDHPSIRIFRSRQELEEYCDTHELAQILGAAAAYDESFFSESDLILVDLGQGSSSIRHEIHTLAPAGDQTWELQGTQTIPEAVTLDMVQWLALAQVSKEVIEPGDTVTVALETVRE